MTGLVMRGDEDRAPVAGAADPVAQIHRLFELTTTGALTDDEFATKKAELLARI